MNCVSGVVGSRGLDVAQAERLEMVRLAVAHDRQRKARDLPFLHGLSDQFVELVGNQCRHAVLA